MSKKVIRFNLSRKSINKAIKDVEAYQRWLDDKIDELVQELAKEGVAVANAKFATAQYDGPIDADVTWTSAGKGKAIVRADGQTVLFIEFGSGIMYAGSHPEETPEVARGSWSEGPEGKGHWDDPNGWYYAHGKKSFGNPANMPMYEAKREIEAKFTEIARRVFAS